MRFFIFILAVFLLASCNTPSVDKLGAPFRMVEAQGLKFKVYFTSTEAEAFRLTPLYPPRLARITPAAEEAITRASGCRVVAGTLRGDPAKLEADLVC